MYVYVYIYIYIRTYKHIPRYYITLLQISRLSSTGGGGPRGRAGCLTHSLYRANDNSNTHNDHSTTNDTANHTTNTNNNDGDIIHNIKHTY